MIEVEKNFDLRLGDKERLIHGAALLSQKTFTDVYYDTSAYDLTGKDYWLRTRDGRFELKVPLNTESMSERVTDQYRELETDGEIALELNLEIKNDFAETLAASGYKPFATIVTRRESYQKGKFHLDFDEMDFGFSTFEVERMVRTLEEIIPAEKQIMDFARTHGIAATAGRGKVTEYLLRNNPNHYQFLVEKGVVRPPFVSKKARLTQ